MTSKLYVPLVGLLYHLPLALASISLPPSYPGVSYTPASSWSTSCPSQGCFDACADYFGTGLALLTFILPTPTTSFQWWGFQSNTAGEFIVCIDGTNCQTLSYFNADATGAPVMLWGTTGLSNEVHTFTIQNIEDTHNGDNFGTMSVDHIVIDGSPVSIPTFPEGGPLIPLTLPAGTQSYHLLLHLGSGTAPLDRDSHCYPSTNDYSYAFL